MALEPLTTFPQRTSKIMMPAPSPITNPDLWLSNGRDDSSGRSLNLVVSARILVKEIKSYWSF